MSTPQHVLVLRDKVQRYLTEVVGHVEIDRDGDFTFQFGSARVFIRCSALTDEYSIVRIFLPLLRDVPLTTDLYHYVATEGSYNWGSLRVVEEGDKGEIYFGHVLLGDYLDPAEFNIAVASLANSGDELDNELQRRFGGERFHEDAP